MDHPVQVGKKESWGNFVNIFPLFGPCQICGMPIADEAASPLSITGLVWAVSPPDGKGARWLGVKLEFDEGGVHDVVLRLRNHIEGSNLINEFILFSGVNICPFEPMNKLSWYLELVETGKYEIISDDRLKKAPSSLKHLIIPPLDVDLFSYTGTVSHSNDDTSIIDSQIVIIGVHIDVNVSVGLYNVFRSHALDPRPREALKHFGADLPMTLLKNSYICVPGFSTIKYLSRPNIEESLPGLQERFLKVLTGDFQEFLRPTISSGYSAVLSQYDDYTQIDSDRMRICHKFYDHLTLTGTPHVNPISGLMMLEDLFLVCSRSNIARISISSFVHVIEKYEVDKITGKTIERSYILAIESSSEDNAQSIPPDTKLYLVNLDHVAPPHLERLNPPSMKGFIKGFASAILSRDLDGWSARALDNKPIQAPLDPSVFHANEELLEVGGFAFVSKDFRVYSAVIVENGPELPKGRCIIDDNSRSLKVSKAAFKHITKCSQSTVYPCAIKDLISGLASDQQSQHSFKGIIKSIALKLDPSPSTASSSLQKIFQDSSIGFPFSSAQFMVDVVDETDPSFSIQVDYQIGSTGVCPLGLVPGSIISGTCFTFSKTCEEQTLMKSTNSCRISILGFRKVTPTVGGSDSDLPFHYLADFSMYPVRFPKKPVIFECYPISMIKLTLSPVCQSCSSAVLRNCCPIHGTTASINIDCQAELIVSDSTFQAVLQIDNFGTLCTLFSLDQLLIKSKISQMGQADCSTWPEFHFTDSFRLTKLRVKGICLEAIQASNNADQLLVKRQRIGQKTVGVLTHKGKILMKAHQIDILSDSTLINRYLNLLNLL